MVDKWSNLRLDSENCMSLPVGAVRIQSKYRSTSLEYYQVNWWKVNNMKRSDHYFILERIRIEW